MTIRHLRIFVTVAESKTMSVAAKKLFISQPTVSQAIRELEDHYGGLLFDRMHKHLYITGLGEKLLASAGSLIHQYDELEEMMSAQKYQQKLRIGATLTIGTCLLPQMLEKYKKEYPMAEVFSCINNTRTIEEKLLASELDLGLVEGKIKSGDLLVQEAMEDELVMVCSMGHPFAKRKELYFCELSGMRFVMREQGSGTREMFEKDLEEHNISVRMAWEVMGTEAIKHAVLMDNCLSVISYRLVAPELRGGRMYMFRRDSNHWKRDFSLVFHKNKYVNDTMQNFIKQVSDESYRDKLLQNDFGELK